ncbi:dynein axonemal heavy chain 2-like [Lates calcarifer]|uniref:Dynein axonemal heavy chain 2-like n=1 Tax=Lates calcarifer TaxID=8187 RepID=A0AAJ8DUP7_LATCA|nr:dynein axonemal heavy chain 2-like [Lates calcarifer]
MQPQVSESLLSLYLNEYEEIPWDALKYLIAGVNYGGHVTDDWDRRLLTTYINDYFCDAAVNQPFFNSSLEELEKVIKGFSGDVIQLGGDLPLHL